MNKKSHLLLDRVVPRPYDYEWAVQFAERQNEMMWLPKEVKLDQDISDWNTRITPEEKELLSHLFRFFTQADTSVADAYYSLYMPFFKNQDIRMMLGSFANMEGIHKIAYAMILDQLGIPESEFSVFFNYAAMAAKHDYLHDFNVNSMKDAARSLAVYSGANEGLQLYVSFAILMNFARTSYEVKTKSGKVETRQKQAKMPGMCKIVEFSFKDESLHVEGMTKLFRTFVQEHPKIFTTKLQSEIKEIFDDMVKLEHDFVDLAFEFGGVEGLDIAEVKLFAKYLADRRLIQLGITPIYGVKHNPFEWLDVMINSIRHDDFFVDRVADYSKKGLEGDLSGVWKN